MTAAASFAVGADSRGRQSARLPRIAAVAEDWVPDPDLWLYRERTVALLKRYFRLSIEVGRLPSLLGREFFRSRVSARHVITFEDTVIFVHDVERALERLDEFEKKLIAVVVLQDYTQDEAAHGLGCRRRTVGRRFPEALDRLSEIFLEGGLLTRLPGSELPSLRSGDSRGGYRHAGRTAEGGSSLRSGTAEAAVATLKKSCQEGKIDEICVSDSQQLK